MRSLKKPKRKFKKYIKTNDNKNTKTENVQDTVKAVLRGTLISNSISPQETRNISNKEFNLTPKATRERRTTKNKQKKQT